MCDARVCVLMWWRQVERSAGDLAASREADRSRMPCCGHKARERARARVGVGAGVTYELRDTDARPGRREGAAGRNAGETGRENLNLFEPTCGGMVALAGRAACETVYL